MAPLGTYRYRVYYGGRASAKSWSLGRALLLHGAQSKLRVLCAREYQASIRQSVHQLLSAQIVEMGLDSFYSVDQAMIRGANWTEIFFAGVKRDPAQIKSMEGIDLCWVAEAQSVSDESWEILIPTIRQERSEIWLEFNPYQVTDPTWQRFVKRPPPRSIVREVSWRDNPWLSSTMREERDELLRRDPEAEAHVWGGQPWSKSGAQVLGGRFRVEAIEPQDDWTGPYFGADWGFARDPTVLVRCWIAGQRLVVDYDVRGIGWNMDEIDRRFRTVPGAADHVIRGDSARPETINELRRRGLNVVAADKWPGSREDGVNHLTGYEEIVIDPRCKALIEEARLWRYKTDPRTGDVLPKLLDGYDHGWDGVRYALAPMIKPPNPWGVANL
jgi:phage terminase large subunit